MTVLDGTGPTVSGREGGVVGPIYLDYHATTPVDSRVAEVVTQYMLAAYGNASSAEHHFGDVAAEAVDRAARAVAALVGASPGEIVWTSGATEAINLALQGFAAARSEAGPLNVVVSPTEHAAVLATCEAMARAGHARLHMLQVDGYGRVDVNEIDAVCHAGADLLCVMAASNEVGTVAPVTEIASIALRHGVAYLCDATQAAGRVPLQMDRDGITFLALSAHKMYGPKGVGALITASRRLLAPLFYGGDQQRGLRAGTLNVSGIAGFGKAAELRSAEMQVDESSIASLRDRLQGLLARELAGNVQINGNPDARLAGNLHVSFLGCLNTAMIARFRRDLAVATGAACSSGIEAPSHVLRAMGLSRAAQDGAIRIGLGKWTTMSEVERAAELLIGSARQVSAMLG